MFKNTSREIWSVSVRALLTGKIVARDKPSVKMIRVWLNCIIRMPETYRRFMTPLREGIIKMPLKWPMNSIPSSKTRFRCGSIIIWQTKPDIAKPNKIKHDCSRYNTYDRNQSGILQIITNNKSYRLMSDQAMTVSAY